MAREPRYGGWIPGARDARTLHDETVSVTLVSSPNAPRPSDPLVLRVSAAIAGVARNYDREGSGPGSRFEGQLLEDAQAALAVRMVLEALGLQS
jgi:hypothetical protein